MKSCPYARSFLKKFHLLPFYYWTICVITHTSRSPLALWHLCTQFVSSSLLWPCAVFSLFPHSHTLTLSTVPVCTHWEIVASISHAQVAWCLLLLLLNVSNTQLVSGLGRLVDVDLCRLSVVWLQLNRVRA